VKAEVVETSQEVRVARRRVVETTSTSACQRLSQLHPARLLTKIFRFSEPFYSGALRLSRGLDRVAWAQEYVYRKRTCGSRTAEGGGRHTFATLYNLLVAVTRVHRDQLQMLQQRARICYELCVAASRT